MILFGIILGLYRALFNTNFNQNFLELLLNKNLIITVIGIAIALTGMVFVFTTPDDENSCMDNVRESAKAIERQCEWEYSEWGYDSPEQCTNSEIGTLPDCG